MKKAWLKGLLITGFVILFNSSAHAASLGLSPGSADLISGCTYTASIVIDTEGINTLATDAFLTYNSSEIEIVDQNLSIPGTQIGIGHTYETYPGNIVSSNLIRLTGFNRTGFFNGRGVLGRIKFRGKPGVTSSVIGFQFSPGSSIDSNIANQDSADILNSVAGAVFTFKTGKCPVPAPPKVPKEPSELEQLRQELEECHSALITLEDYYKDGKDETGEYLCESVRPAAPSGPPTGLLLLLLILLALSLLLNIDMLVRPDNHIVSQLPFGKQSKVKKAKFRKHRIREKRRK